MGYKLTVDQFRAASERLGEIQRQLSQADYPFDPNGLPGALNAIMEGRFSAVGGFPSSALAAEYAYAVVEDVVGPTDFQVKDLEFILFLEEGRKVTDGNTMRSRAVTLRGNFGLCDAPRFLEQSGDIPTELSDTSIVLAGTKLRDCDGVFYVACLHCRDGKQWYLCFIRINTPWEDDCRLPRCK